MAAIVSSSEYGRISQDSEKYFSKDVNCRLSAVLRGFRKITPARAKSPDATRVRFSWSSNARSVARVAAWSNDRGAAMACNAAPITRLTAACASELADTSLDMFVASMPGDIEKLKLAIAGGNAAEVCSAAHFIKGVAANLCASALNKAAFEIEQSALHGNIERAVELVPRLESSWLEFLKHPGVMQRL